MRSSRSNDGWRSVPWELQATSKTIPMMAWQPDAHALFLHDSFQHPVTAGEGDSEGTNRDPQARKQRLSS